MLKHRLSSFLLGFCLLTIYGVNAEVAHIGNQELAQMLKDGIPVIDVRRAEEWAQTGIVEGSHLLTFFDNKGNYDFPKWMETFNQIVPNPDEPFILICRTGNRTNTISQALDKQLGYTKVYNVKKGISHWKAEKLPLIAPSQPDADEK